jgi:hypothetical protein
VSLPPPPLCHVTEPNNEQEGGRGAEGKGEHVESGYRVKSGGRYVPSPRPLPPFY